MNFILGKKIEMNQLFDEQGKVVPVTLIQAGPCYVTQIKTGERDGYDAVQIGFEKIDKRKRLKKTMKGKPYRYLKEARGEVEDLKIGDEINVSIFKPGDKVKISGISKGKGFAGAVKRWGFADKAKAHGAKDMRRVGSIGSRFPQRVIKGKKMPGRMGSDRVTIKNLKVVAIDEENNILAVKGAVPGRRGTLLEIRKQG
jgi:large subunit ribosomal protein L3